MRAQFIVTIEGSWMGGDKRATQSVAGALLREAVRDQFEFLADSVKVREVRPEQIIGSTAAIRSLAAAIESDAAPALNDEDAYAQSNYRHFMSFAKFKDFRAGVIPESDAAASEGGA